MSPRAFTEQEKEAIQEKLLDAAEAFLSTTGIRKTTVEDLAKAAGISKGAFYSFYESKEVLFWEALMREHAHMHELINEHIGDTEITRDVFVEMVGGMYRGFIKKPWILDLIEGDYEVLMRSIPPEQLQRNMEIDNATMGVFEQAIADNTSVNPELVSAALRLLFLSVLHRQEIGREWADGAFMLMLESLADRIFKEEA